MSRLSWNCRGLGNVVTVLCVLETQVFISRETQVLISRVEGLKKTLGYDNAFAVSSNGYSAGLGNFLE